MYKNSCGSRRVTVTRTAVICITNILLVGAAVDDPNASCAAITKSPALIQQRKLVWTDGSTSTVGSEELTERGTWRSPLVIQNLAPPPPSELRGRGQSDDIVDDGFNSTNEGRAAITQCGHSVKLNEHYKMEATCPQQCPFYVQDQNSKDFCTAMCVEAKQCAFYNPLTPVADPALGSCREASLDGCQEASKEDPERCVKCWPGYSLSTRGHCIARFTWLQWTGIVIVGVVCLVVIVYAIELNMRPVTNVAGLKQALTNRTAQKNRMPNLDGAGLRPWPITTNLCNEAVGGPTLTLHFRFQAVVILWAIIIFVSWVILALAVDSDLLILGRRPFGNAYKNCVLVFWGSMTQKKLMWAKTLFLGFVYAGSFLGALIYGVVQLRFWQFKDETIDTMKDFAIHISGLPQFTGEERIEEELQGCIAGASGQNVVGVSICWDLAGQLDLVTDTCVEELHNQQLLERAASGAVGAVDMEESTTLQMGFLRRSVFKLEQLIFQARNCEDTANDTVLKSLHAMKGSSEAFAVFETEEIRDLVLKKLSQDFEFRGSKLTVSRAADEPDSVLWGNFDDADLWTMCKRLARGALFILLGVAIWGGVFYAPYAWTILTFNYTGGQQPGFIYSLIFSLVVCAGNQMMYEICSRVSDSIGFRGKGRREACYMVLYLAAVALNILLDLATTYYMAYEIIINLHFRSVDGRPVQEIPYFMEKFHTYAMQRLLGQNMYEYAFPATFLVPYILEPLGTVYILMRICLLVVRTHPELKPWVASSWLAPLELDLGRYADILINVSLAVLMLFFPGGYTHKIFFWLAVSSIWIYVFDHWRILRVVPATDYTTYEVEYCAQASFAPICGLLFSCLVLKSYCDENRSCSKPEVGWLCVYAFVGHTTLHILLLRFVVPLFGRKSDRDYRPDAKTYREVAKTVPANWFSVNPTHCLRSRFIYRHSPPCSYYQPGAEKHMEVNESIGCFYTEVGTEWEDPANYELSVPSWTDLKDCMGDLAVATKSFAAGGSSELIKSDGQPQTQ
eukprot:TRINITY_DN3801_c1_g1_i1.p1 TRINITY_DN3801_c1_g1~~TRINITY_DN3801_c1_g1_i1.p1  ORF type:complete len:1019 (-),score=135.26 TRINITY_DN3801_c1_g1_i1:434-3490(-)